MKLIVIAALLVVWTPPLKSTPCKSVLRLQKEAMNYACQTQRQPLRDIFKLIQIPVNIGTGILGSALKFAGIQILEVNLPTIDVNLLHGKGIQVSVETNFQIAGNIILIGNIGIKAGAGVLIDLRLTRSTTGFPVVSVSACKTIMGGIKVTGGFGLVSSIINTVSNHISAVLGDNLCVSVSNVFLKINGQLGLLVGLNPIAQNLGIQYTLPSNPIVTDNYMDMDMNVEYEVNGKPVEVPSGEANFYLPPEAGNPNAMVNMGLSPEFFSSLFLAFQTSAGFDVYISPQTPSMDRYLTTSALGNYIPEISQKYPGALPADVKIVVSRAPVVTLQPNMMLVQIYPYVVLSLATATREELVALNMGVTLISSFSINEGKLKPSIALTRDFAVDISSSSVGAIMLSGGLKNILNIFLSAFVSMINERFGPGIALPSMPNVQLMNGVVMVQPEYTVVSCDVQYVK